MISVSTLTANADLVFGPGPRPWSEHWAIVQEAYSGLETFFTTPDPTADQHAVLHVVNSFAVVCYHFKDHLKSDPAVPEQVQQSVEQYVDDRQALSLLGHVANTVKHRERKGSQRYARVGEVLTGPKAVLHWTDPQDRVVREDVLDVARAGMQDWKDFLLHHRLVT